MSTLSIIVLTAAICMAVFMAVMLCRGFYKDYKGSYFSIIVRYEGETEPTRVEDPDDLISGKAFVVLATRVG